jgi:hypothetical protein
VAAFSFAGRYNAGMDENLSSADSPVPAKKSKRRWFQFSLRSLLIFTMICAVASAWLGRKMEQKRREQEAVKAIVKLGGLVGYDSEEITKDRNGQMRVAGPRGPDWLRRFLGEYFFSEIRFVSLNNVRDIDAALAKVSGLAQVQMLSFGVRGSDVTDATLVRLNGLPQIQGLSLQGTKVTDAGLVNLKGLIRLTSLELFETNVTDAGLVHLRGFANLQRLDLDETNVSDAGLAHLKRLTKLQYLWLKDTKVTDAGVKDLQQALPNITIVR